jgi:hypothetical protein
MIQNLSVLFPGQGLWNLGPHPCGPSSVAGAGWKREGENGSEKEKRKVLRMWKFDNVNGKNVKGIM